MGLKILHSADWHMGAPFASISEEQRSFLRQGQLALPGKIARISQEENCDLVLLAGDVFDGKPSREVLSCVKAALAQCGVPVLISPGNHDFCGPDSVWQEESWPENVFIFSGNLESVTISTLDCRIYGAGYRSMDCPPLLQGFQARGQEKWQIALLHGDPVNRNSPYCPITMSQIRNSGLSYLALGHIHKAQMIRGGNTLCAWPGCPMGRGWDETGEKGVCIVTLGDAAGVRFVPLDTPRFFDLTVEVEADATDALERMFPAAPGNDFYRITLTGYGSGNVEDIRKRFQHLPNLRLQDKRQLPEELWADADTDSLLGIYFRRLQELSREDPNAAEAARISRRILSGREVSL